MKITKTIASVVSAIAFVAVLTAGANAATFTRSLTVGSTGADVTVLQTWLNQKGYLSVSPTGYFGNLTKAAVAAFQVANGITPAAGYFGPITQAKWEMLNSGSSNSNSNNGSSSSVKLAGTDGSIDAVKTLSQYSSEEVGENESDVKVAGFEVEASNDGDIALRSVKVTFDATGNGHSTKIKDYVKHVTVWQGSKEVGSADASDFTKDSSNSKLWTKTITLSNSVVKSDSKEKFYITVDGASTFDSSDIADDSWTVGVNNIRFEDGSGVVTTDSETGDLGNGGSTIGWASAGDGVAVDFVSFSTASNTELKFSTDSSTPDEQVVLVDDQDNTNDVVLLKGKIKVDGTSDVTIDQLPVTLTATGATDVDYITGSIKLTIDGEDYTESVNTSSATVATVTFDNLDLTLSAGKTYSFTVTADINNTDSNFEDGDTLKASISASNRAMIDAENEEGDQLTSSEKTGLSTGKAQEFRVNGVQVTLVSTDTSATTGTSSNDDMGTFKIKFKVKASGDTVYVSSLVANAVLYVVDKAGTATTGNSITATITDVTDSDKTSVGNYEIEDGSEETFELIVTAQLGTAGTAGQYRAALTGVKWDTSDDTSPANTYTSNLDSFKTSYIGLN